MTKTPSKDNVQCASQTFIKFPLHIILLFQKVMTLTEIKARQLTGDISIAADVNPPQTNNDEISFWRAFLHQKP